MARTIASLHDSPLGRWTRAFYFPDAPLAAHVEMLWYVSGRTNFVRDRRLPNGRSHLLFNLGTPALLFEDADRTREFPFCWIAGQREKYIETGSQGDTTLLGVQFCSHGAYPLLRIAQRELGDSVIPLDALLGDRVLSFRQRLLEAQSPQACFALLEQWLLGLLERGAPVHASVLALNSAVTTSHGQLDLKELSRDLGVSREHLIRRFREQVGLTPKAYANVVRFNRALQLARRRRSLWSNIAADCGYFDQSHLIRDFQRYAGRAPSSLLLDRMPDADSIVIA